MRNVSKQSCRQNQNTHFTFGKKWRRLCDNTVERGMPQMTIWRMRVACWMTNSYKIYVSVKHNKFITQINAHGKKCFDSKRVIIRTSKELFQCILYILYIRVHFGISKAYTSSKVNCNNITIIYLR